MSFVNFIMKRSAAVLAGIAGVLLVAGGAVGAQYSIDVTDAQVTGRQYDGTLAATVSGVKVYSGADPTTPLTLDDDYDIDYAYDDEGVDATEITITVTVKGFVVGTDTWEDGSGGVVSLDLTDPDYADGVIKPRTLAIGDFEVDPGIPPSGLTAPAATEVSLKAPLDAGDLDWKIVYSVSGAFTGGDIIDDLEDANLPPETELVVGLRITAVDDNYDAVVGEIINLNITYTTPDIYAASVTPTTKTFPAAPVGYGTQTRQTFTITNDGLGALSGIAADLVGENADNYFEFFDGTSPGTDLIGWNGTAKATTTVGVRPKTGILDPGTYTAILRITATELEDDIDIPLSFTVQPIKYAVSLSPRGYAFSVSATQGGYVQPSNQTLTLSNTGNAAIPHASLNVTLSGTRAEDYFDLGTLTGGPSTALDVADGTNPTKTVTIRPKTGLAASTTPYTAKVVVTVTISGTVVTKDSVQVSFTVNPQGATTPVISQQPVDLVDGDALTATEITADDVLEVVLSSPPSTGVSYAWYSTTAIGGYSAGTAVSGATARTFRIPTTLAAGDFYYFVKVTYTASGLSASTNSTIAHVRVNKKTYTESTRFTLAATTRKDYNGKAQGVDAVEVSKKTDGETYAYTYQYKLDGVLVGGVEWGAREQPVNAGTYSVQVKAESQKEIWTSTVQTFIVRPKALANSMITALGTYYKTYDGAAKEPYPTVYDADTKQNLVLGTDYEGNGTGGTDNLYKNNINAGTTAEVTIKGKGNYSGSSVAVKTFEITKKPVTIVAGTSAVAPRVYDGTTALDTAAVTVRFEGLVGDEALQKNAAYTLSNAKLSSANVGTSISATATVALKADHEVAKNYSLASGSFSKSGAWITPKTIGKEDFAFDTLKLTTHLYTGTTHGTPGGVAPVTFAFTQPSPAKLTLLYTYPPAEGRTWSGDTTIVPVDSGSYDVKVRVETAANYGIAAGAPEVVALGTYVIGSPLKPEIVKDLDQSATVRRGKPLVMAVEARSPNGAAGSVKYQWFRNDTLISGATNASYTYTPSATTPLGAGNKYFVRITNDPGAAIQIPASDTSTVLTVTVEPAPTSIAAARVTVDGEYTYTGEAQLPQNVSVRLDGQDLSESVHYTYTVANNTNAGTAIVTVTGVDAYEGTASGSFKIAKKELEQEDIAYVATRTYNGAAQPLAVTASNGRTGLGAVTVTYATTATPPATLSGPPTNAGTYAVTVKVAEGANFTGSDSAFALGTYTIVQKVVVAADLNYTPWPAQILVDSAKATGIGPVTLKELAAAYTGKINVLYDGKAEVPTEVGSYLVLVEITGDTNFLYNLVDLGTYNIVDELVSVAKTDRVVPKPAVTTEAAVAPVKAAAGSFTAGPSPVQKNSVIKFFSAKQVKSGTLYIFDANGNAVAKVAAKQGSGEIAKWTANAAEGSYVVKGALVGKDGTREKVSFVFSVVK